MPLIGKLLAHEFPSNNLNDVFGFFFIILIRPGLGSSFIQSLLNAIIALDTHSYELNDALL